MLASVSARRVLIAAFALVLVVLAFHPTWARAVGADVWNVPALQNQLHAEANEDERLGEEAELVHTRIMIKEGIVTNMLAGRITLAEATERFTVLNASRPRYLDAIRKEYPGATDEEKMARNVIGYALPRVPANERDTVACRMEAELGQMLAAGAAH